MPWQCPQGVDSRYSTSICLLHRILYAKILGHNLDTIKIVMKETVTSARYEPRNWTLNLPCKWQRFYLLSSSLKVQSLIKLFNKNWLRFIQDKSQFSRYISPGIFVVVVLASCLNLNHEVSYDAFDWTIWRFRPIILFVLSWLGSCVSLPWRHLNNLYMAA